MASSFLYNQGSNVPPGQLTQTIYSLVRGQRFAEAVQLLEQQLQFVSDSRPGLSLLAYCHYHSGSFEQAASTYEQLTRICPSEDAYKLHLAQSLFKVGMHAEAAKAAVRVTDPNLTQHVNNLLAVIAFEQDNLPGCRRQLEQCAAGCEVEVAVNTGCVLFKEGDYEGAAARFKEAAALGGTNPAELQYNIALCCYKLKQYSQALKHLAEIVERGVREHPELGVGSQLHGMDVRSVGNSQALKETALIEAFNLKAATELMAKNTPAAEEALADMPPRSESELDPVTLHNMALVHMDKSPGAGFKKLNFLLSSSSFPRETFANLLLLYCAPQHGFLDLAADVMAEDPEYCATLLTKDLLDLLQCLIQRKQQPEAALQQLDELAGRHIESLRNLTKLIQDVRLRRDNDGIRAAIQQYDDALERYIPVLMAMGSILWEQGAYSALEQLFRQSAEFCSEHDTWRLNVAHTFFMQESKYRDAIRFYQPLIARNTNKLLGVTAIVLANLCVSYIMTSQNEEAEELMRHVEQEEEEAAMSDPGGLQLHLCIINLVIGTLYCSKGNYEFGVSRVIKSLEPYSAKLSTDTWFYAKRCLLSLVDGLAKHMIPFKAEAWDEVLGFLEEAEAVGHSIPASFAEAGAGGGAAALAGGDPRGSEGATVASEARLLRALLLKMSDTMRQMH